MNRNHPNNFRLESGIKELPISHPSVGYVISGFDAYSSGANAWQELAYVCNCLEPFLANKSSREVTLEMGIGENLVVELAKFRALDWLVQAICEKQQHYPSIRIRCKTGWRNKTSYHVNDNQIRQTVEAMCGFISGAQELCITPYDFAYATSADFVVRRMALNTVHILENEAELKDKKSYIKGSFIVQHHAHWLCDKVWSVLNSTSSENFQHHLQQEIENTNQLRKQQISIPSKPIKEANDFREISGVFGGIGVNFQNL
jgi:methylmalonyl-CoA mutase N-terminal domain/subunit